VLGKYEVAAAAEGGDAHWVREALGRDGIVFVKDDVYVGGPFPDFYHSTFHAPWYVFEHWGRFFTVRGYLPRRALDFQDAVVLERPSDDDTSRTVRPVEVARSVVGADDTGEAAPAPGRPSDRAGELLHRGPDAATDSRWGPAGVVARRAAERLVGHLHEHHRRVDVALFEAVREIESRIDARTVSGGNTLLELNARLWDVVGRQGERINRLEADLSSEIRELRRRLDEADGQGRSEGPW
jgi:hypothetical protein